MRRPLLCVCMGLFVIIAFWMHFTNPPPLGRAIVEWEGEQVLLYGQVYKKEVSIRYGKEIIVLHLKSVKFSNNHSEFFELSQVNPNEKVICEIEAGSFEAEKKIPKLGSLIVVEGKWKNFEHATNPGEFDWADYYAIEGIGAKLSDVQIGIEGNSYWPIREGLFRLRQKWLRNIYQGFPYKEASILAKMLLGNGSGISQEIRDLYQKNGIVHILSISGLHISLLGMGLYKGLRKITLPIIPSALFGGGLIVLYGLMIGFGISPLRAIGMYLIHMWGEIRGRTYDMLTAMGVLCVFLLIGNPFFVYHSGFLLSFFSVCGVGVLSPWLQIPDKYFHKKSSETMIAGIIKKLVQKFCGALGVSCSVTVFTLPIQLFFFYEVPAYGVFINLLILPFMGLVMVIGLLVMLLPEMHFLSPLEVFIFQWFEEACRFFEKLPMHQLLFGKPDMWKILFYYAGLFCLVWGHKYIRGAYRQGMLFLLLLFLLVPGRPKDRIVMLDVGQGDCICVQTKTGQVFLFDCGSSTGSNVGQKILLPYLKSSGIHRIDGVFLSHGDKDHCNAFAQLIESGEMKIEKVYLPNLGENGKKAFEEIINLTEPEKVEYINSKARWKTEEMELICLYPDLGTEGEGNEYSACFLLRLGAFSMLFTGDIEGEGEMRLIRVLEAMEVDKVDVLKVAHHGSSDSSSKELLRQIHPEYALISCGENNPYGHPHRDTIMRLLQAESEVYTTAKSGAIIIEPYGKEKIVQWKY